MSVLLALLLPIGVGMAMRCEPIAIPMCADLGYNSTTMPNIMDNKDQEQAAQELETYSLLVKSQCSPDVRHFLCSIFAPFCTKNVNFPITSCRSVCERVMADCQPAMARVGLEWPASFNCSRFPEPRNICMQNVNRTEAAKRDDIEVYDERAPPPWWPNVATNRQRHLHRCPPNFVRTSNHGGGCAPECNKDAYYRLEDKKFAESWFTGWAWMCFISTLFTLLTYCVDSARFRYPERPVIFLAVCNNAVAVAYVVRGSFGSKAISCTDIQEEDGDGGSYVAVDGLESASCTFLFLVLYYFSMSSAVWFINLTLSWYLSAAKKWSTEALENVSSYFHVAAWTVPAVFSVAALVLRKVSADELTGLCQVSDAAAVPFMVVPHAVLLVVGVALALLGGAGLVRVRRALAAAARPTAKLERLMSRLFAFCALFALAAVGHVACVVYESTQKPRWQALTLWAALECQYQTGCGRPPAPPPLVEVALLRLFLSLAGGVATGMWVWSGKTCRAWGGVFANRPPNKHSNVVVVAPLPLPPKRCFYAPVGRPMHVSRV